VYRVTNSGLAGDQPGCTFLEGGVFKPQCWCLDHPALCSPDNYKAAVGWAYPGMTYAPIQPPPVPGAPTGDKLTVPSASGADAQQTIDDILAAQMKAWQAQNAGTMAETQGNLDAIDTSVTNWNPLKLIPDSTNWLLIGGLALVGVVALSAVGGGSPRRYGR
jgi:hypothetical protein